MEVQTTPASHDTFGSVRALAAAALAPLRLLVPSHSPRTDIAKIWLISLTSTAFFLFAEQYVIPGGSSHFTAWANALTHGGTLDARLAQRDIGFPLLLWLTGYPNHGSLIPLTLLHASFAVLLPVLVYQAIYNVSSGVAFYAAVASVVSLTPILFMKWLHHDHLYVFASVLMLSVLISAFASPRPVLLYAFTAAALLASLSRPAGNLLFPAFLLIAYAVRRGARRHYLICLAVFVVSMAGYQWHRYIVFDIANQPTVPSYTGQQVFYNLYQNSREFGIRLSPDLGPNMRRIHDRLRASVLPAPRDSTFIASYALTYPPAERFLQREVYPLSPDAFMRRVYDQPNWEFFMMMSTVEVDDGAFFDASWEIVKRYPTYPLRYGLRNLALFLVEPGYAHARYSTDAFGRLGLTFPADGRVDETTGMPPAAVREAYFDPLVMLPRVFYDAYDAVRRIWLQAYDGFVKVTLLLMVVAWAGLAAGVLRRVGGAVSGTNRIPAALASRVYAAPVTAVSAAFFYNAAVTALFAEPDYRYHHFVLPIRIILAAYGGWVIVSIVRTAMTVFRVRSSNESTLPPAVAPSQPAIARSFAPPGFITTVLACLTVSVGGGWTMFMVKNAHATSIPKETFLRDTCTISIGTRLEFGRASAANSCLSAGWSAPEPTGIWSEGDLSRVTLYIADSPATDVILEFAGFAYLLPGKIAAQEVRVLVAGEVAGTASVTRSTPDETFRVAIRPTTIRSDVPLTVDLAFPGAATPREIAGTADDRQLALHLRWLRRIQ